MEISRLQKVPLRKLWPHEAHDFTTWLAENMDFLSEAVGFGLSLVEREAAAGPFYADILAEDHQGNFVIIENQLERTDHDHLGKLLTYLSNLEAKTAIWITSDPRPEHETAIHWLNETLPVDTAFFLLRIEAYIINGSLPAPLLTVVAGPSPESKQVGAQKKELAQRHVSRLRFWEQLLARAKAKTSLHANISPSKDNWINAGSGKSGLHYGYVIRMNDAQVQMAIEQSDAEWNKAVFDKLYQQKGQIEEAFGNELEWQRNDGQISSRIRHLVPEYGLVDEAHWQDLNELMIDAMVRLHKALQPEIDRLR